MDTENRPDIESTPPSTSPSGWALILSAIAIALAVLMILGLGFGIGYLLDLRNGVDTFNSGAGSAQCTTNT